MLRLGRRADKLGWPVTFKEFKSILEVGEGVLFGETLKYVGWIIFVKARITKTTANVIMRTPILKKAYPVVFVFIEPSQTTPLPFAKKLLIFKKHSIVNLSY